MCCLLFSQGCGIYSFSGNSLPPKAKSFSLYFQSEVALGPADLAAKFQQRLGEELLQLTSLKQVDSKGDLQLDGVIKKFDYMPVALKRSGKEGTRDRASMNRLTIEVELNYINPYDATSAFSKKIFSHYDDMDTSTSSQSEEPRLVEAIFTKLVEDIFNETVASW
jgi:hypothetical protein